MDSNDIKAAVEGAFGPGAFDLIASPETSDIPKATDPSGESLESVIAKIDSQVAVNNDTAESGRETANASTPVTTAHVQRFLAFRIHETFMAVPMENVLAIQRMPLVTNVPRTPEWLQGVTNLRGTVVSVVDFAELFSVHSVAPVSESRLMVAQSLVDDISVGFVIEHVLGIRSFDTRQIVAPAAPIDGKLANFLRGLIDYEDQLVAVIDVEKLLLSSDLRLFDAA